MIDGPTYRNAKRLAKQHLAHWHLAQAHTVCFEGPSEFPKDVDAWSDLYPILDTMQEGRYEGFVREAGGLTKAEILSLLQALGDYVLMHRMHFPHRTVRVPLATMASALMVVRKIERYFPGTESVLEIGPGCGATFFMLRRLESLKRYASVEASEAYYLLQGLVGSYCFGVRFEERAYPRGEESAAHPFSVAVDTSAVPILEFSPEPVAVHYPWWHLGELAQEVDRYDAVLANANLMEFSDVALQDYAALIQRVLRPEGILLSQCLGGQVQRKEDGLLDFMYAQGFGALALMHPGDPLGPGDSGVHMGPVVTGVFVKQGHPQYEEARNLLAGPRRGMVDDARVASMFRPSVAAAAHVTAGEMVKLVIQALEDQLGKGCVKKASRPEQADSLAASIEQFSTCVSEGGQSRP